MTQKYDQNAGGDLRNIMDHYWIKRQVEAGNVVKTGIANNRGEVVVDGRVVANNAQSIGRQPIKNSSPIQIAGKTYYQTSHVGGAAFRPGTTQLEAIVVLGQDGSFKYAIIKSCGNPIYAAPVAPPAPKPEPPKPVAEKSVKVCDISTKTWVTVKESEAKSDKYSTNSDDCKIEVCDLSTKQIVKIDQQNFDEIKYSKDTDACSTTKVCRLADKQWVEVSDAEYKENSAKYSKDQKDCEDKTIQLCDIETMSLVRVKESEAKNDKYTDDLSKCQKAPEPAPMKLPTTGPGSIVSAGVGLSAIGLATYYYYISRRNF